MRFSVDDAFGALARFVVRFRFAIVVFWVAVAVITSGALPSLGSKVNNNNSAFLRSSAPSVKAANLASPVLGGTASGRIAEITIVASRSGPLTGADLQAVARVASLARGVHRVPRHRACDLRPGRHTPRGDVPVVWRRRRVQARARRPGGREAGAITRLARP